MTASEADPERGFMARTMALCSLPRTNPGNRKEYIRRNGPYTLAMTAGVNNKLPYGNFPRLILAWVCSEAVRTQSRELILGASLADFMRTLGVYSSGGGREHTKLRNQMRRLFNAYVQLIYEDKLGEASVNAVIARRTEFWWNERKPDKPMLWKSKIELSEDFFNEIITSPGADRPEHPHGAQALFAGPRSLPVVGLPDLPTSRSAADHLAAGVPSVRSGPDPRQRQGYRPQLPTQGSPRVEEDQDRVAGVELLDSSGRPNPASLDSVDPSGFGTSRISQLGPLWVSPLSEAP